MLMEREGSAASGLQGAPREAPPGRETGWLLVMMLTLLYILSFLDRSILLLLIPPLTREMDLSDSQIALLFGLGFGLVYVLAGLPLAHIIDRSRRLSVVAVGVALWSSSTIASAFAPNYTMLLIGRAGVAIGEAALTPAAVSLIADLFTGSRRTAAMATYTSVGVLMPSGAFIVGAAALALANDLSGLVDLAPWRLTLLIVGFPGLVLAPTLLLFREPTRSVGLASDGDYTTVAQAWRYVRGRGRLWGMLFLAMCLSVTASSAMVTWTSTLMVRAFGVTSAYAGYAFGLAGTAGATAGMIFWPWAASHLATRGRRDALVLALAAGMIFFCASVACIGIAPTLPALLLAVGVAMFAMTTTSLLPPLVIQAAAPARMRARLMAGSLVASGLFGLALGSWLTAVLARYLFSDVHALGYAMTTIAIVLIPLIAMIMRVARSAFLDTLDKLQVGTPEE